MKRLLSQNIGIVDASRSHAFIRNYIILKCWINEKHKNFLTYVELPLMLHDKIKGFLHTIFLSPEDISKLSFSQRFANIWKADLTPFAPVPSIDVRVLSESFPSIITKHAPLKAKLITQIKISYSSTSYELRNPKRNSY